MNHVYFINRLKNYCRLNSQKVNLDENGDRNNYSLSRREESCKQKLSACLLACLSVRRGSKKHKG
jgi:hypothetical protein